MFAEATTERSGFRDNLNQPVFIDGRGMTLMVPVFLAPRIVKLIFYTTVSEVIDYQRVAVLETA